MKKTLSQFVIRHSLFVITAGILSGAQVPVVWDTSTGEIVSAVTAIDATNLDLADDYSPTGTWDFTGGTIVVTDSDLPATLTRDSEIGTLAAQDAATIGLNLLPSGSRSLGGLGSEWTTIWGDNVYSTTFQGTNYDFGTTDATITRSGAGTIAVEGVEVLTTATGQLPPAEGAFVDGDKAKLDGIEAAADVTDTANVTAAGAVMDSELADEAGIKNYTETNLTSSGGTLTTTDTTVDFSTAATAVLSLTVGGNAVTPFTFISEPDADSIAATADDFELGPMPMSGGVQLRSGQSRSGVYTDGTDEAATIPSVWETEFGAQEDCAFYLTVRLPDYTPAADVDLFNGLATNQGINLRLETTGALTLQLGDGTTTTDYTTAFLLDDWPAYSELQLTVSLDRSGNASFAVNGNVIETEDISAQEDDDISAGQDYVLLDGSAGYALGYTAILNRALTTAEIALAYQMPDWIARQVPGDIIGTAFDAYSQRDEPTATDDIVVSNGTRVATAEVSEQGRTDIAKLTGLGVGGANYWELANAGTVQNLADGETYFVRVDLYVPSANAQWTGMGIRTEGITPTIIETYDGGTPIQNEWRTYSGTITPGGGDWFLRIYPQDGDNGSRSIAASTDTLYVDNFKVYGRGAAVMADLTEAGATKSDLINWADSAAADATRGTNAIDTIE